MENENNFRVVSSLREDNRLWLIVGIKIYGIEKAENAVYRSDQSINTLNSEGTVQCLKIQFLHDMQDLKTRRMLAIAFGSTDGFARTWDKLGDVRAIADYGLYGVIIYEQHMVGYVVIDQSGETIYSNRMIFAGHLHNPEFDQKSIKVT